MKLKELHKHFRWDGTKWVPKRQFRNEKEIRKAKFFSARWIHYRCDICDNYHIADRSKREDV
jgi:hypothetical protein